MGCIFALLSMIVCNCSQDEPALQPGRQTDPNVMTFSVTHPQSKSASTRATDTNFEAADRIGLFITQANVPLEPAGNYATNACLSFDGTNWATAKPLYWDGGTYDIYAYYPFAEQVGSTEDYPFSVALDQSGTGYVASDFLWAKNKGAAASNEAVGLQFSHRMSRILIKLVKGDDYEGELPEEAEVRILNTVPQATIDLSVGVVTRDAYATAQTIRARSLGNHKYTALIVPQRLVNRQPLVEVIMKGVSYLYESKFVFKQGMQHSVILAVSKNPEQIKIEIGGEIENWE